MRRKTNPGDEAEQVRVLRMDMENSTIGGYMAAWVFNKLAERGFRHRSTVVTPDGRWAVVTMVKNDLDEECDADDWKG